MALSWSGDPIDHEEERSTVCRGVGFLGRSSVTDGALDWQVFRKWLLRLWHAMVGAMLHAWEFLRRICSSAERPLHFVKVQLGVPSGEKELNPLKDEYAEPMSHNQEGMLSP